MTFRGSTRSRIENGFLRIPFGFQAIGSVRIVLPSGAIEAEIGDDGLVAINQPDGEVVVMGCIDHFQVWDAAVFEERLRQPLGGASEAALRELGL